MPKINIDDYDLDNYDDLYDDLISETQSIKNQSRSKKSSSYKEEFQKAPSRQSQNKIQAKARHREEEDILNESDQDIKDEPIRTMAQAAREEAYQKRKEQQEQQKQYHYQAPQARPSVPQALVSQNAQIQPKPTFTFGPNTHEIKSIKIDFDRVVGMERVQGEFKGNETFGIVFRFKGSAGSSRTIWFGRNIYERDAVFVSESRFWASLQLSKNYQQN